MTATPDSTSVIDRPSATLAQDIAAGLSDIDAAVTRLADDDRTEGIAALAERRTGLARTDALALLEAAAELPAALLCRALGLSLNGYSAVLRMRHRRRRDGRTLPAVLLSAYGGVAKPTPEELRKQVEAQQATARADLAFESACAER